ncbi:RNA-binding cell elongation regulator Jag/EloR [Sporanaerobacter acetigenes]|uniref:RNA-binding protein KhpB n=1 Tax=Sporanaerobacter acetigenes DSM 13106 TaxID=1123281 RepID=A0A1M5YTP3_9FIRM|nr:RNA-binding cell elongation regulator Jag/EloR [Sporanaerobacter acetigenes]SHI15442.1 spoIIIJ-associated protein [Sporanaerobacter acetigenes DSM 13106]
MRSVVKVSKTIEDAIEEAVRELGVDREDVYTEIVEEPSKGLFGLIGAKDAKVKVTVVSDPVEIAENFIDMLMNSMGISARSSVKRKNSTLYVDIDDISSTDMGILIGRRGNTLDAVQYLLSLIINKDRENYIKVLVDTKGYRKKREETLIRLAHKMADKAKYSKRPVRLEPMNPYERRIIHSALQNVEGVTTHSEGEEPYRRVVIESN